MKKLFLILSLAATVLTASAVEPKGNASYYSVNQVVNTMFGAAYYTGLAATVYEDGNDIYVPFFCAGLPDMYFKGTVSEDGKTVTFSKSEKAGEYYGYDLYLSQWYFENPEVVEEGEPTSISDVVLQKDGNHLYLTDDIEALQYYIMLDAYMDGEYQGYLDYTACVDFEKMADQPEKVQIPASATKKQYSYVGYDTYAEPSVQLGNVYFDGNDVYFDHYAGMEAVVKGTINGDKVTIAKDQFLGAQIFMLYSGTYVTEWQTDEEDNYIGEALETFTFDYNAETGVFSSLDPTVYQSSFSNGEFNEGVAGLVVEPYAGDKPSIPSDPAVALYDFQEDYGQFELTAQITNLDVNGKYINPEKIEIVVVEDGDYLTLTADDGYALSADQIWMPEGFMDEDDGYDLMFVGGSAYFYLYESLFDQLGVQVRYTVDGVTNYSNIVYASLEGDVTVVEVDHTTGVALPSAISNVQNAESAKTYFNLYGQKIEKAQKGLNIVNGKMKFVK